MTATPISPDGYENLRRNLLDGGSAPPVPAASGTRLGKYLLQREIGRGGMGTVHEAIDMDLKRRVALKLIQEGQANPTLITRLHREAAIAAQLQHPNIVGIHEVGVLRDASGRATHFISMDYVEGETLADRLADPKSDRAVLLKILESVARAVAAAHAKGIIHRDIKPSNILIDAQGRALLTDFGLARATQTFSTRLTETKAFLGTPHYMAPEQIRGSDLIDARTDIYGLGVVLYEILARRLPFRETTAPKLFDQILNEEPDRPAGVEEDLAVICSKAMEKESVRRYASALDLADDLRRFLDGEPIQARPPSVLYRLGKRLRKRKAVMGALAGGILAVVLTLIALLPQLRTAKVSQEAARKEALDKLKAHSQDRLRLILALRRSGDLAAMRREAEPSFTMIRVILKDYPDLAEPHYQMGRIHRALMNEDAALEAQEKALSRNPDLAAARYERIVLTAQQYGRRTRDVFDSAWQANPLGRDRALSRLTASKDDPASARFRTRIESDLVLLERDPGIGEDLKSCARGLLAWAAGDVTECRTHLGKAIGMTSDLEEAYEGLARIEFEKQKFEEGARVATEGIQRDRGYLPLYDVRARCLMFLGEKLNPETDESDAVFNRALEDCAVLCLQDPANTEHLLLQVSVMTSKLARLLTRGKDVTTQMAEALRIVDQALEKGDKAAEAWLSRGRLHCMQAQHRVGGQDPDAGYRLAVEDFTRGINLAPDDDAGWRSRGMARAMWGMAKTPGATGAHFTAALSDLDKSIDLHQGRASSWFWRGVTRVQLAEHQYAIKEDPAEHARHAIEDFEAVEKAGFASDNMHRYRALAFNMLGFGKFRAGLDPESDFRNSIRDLDRIITPTTRQSDLFYNYGAANFFLAHYLESKKRPAVAEWRAALDNYVKAGDLNPGLKPALVEPIAICRKALDIK